TRELAALWHLPAGDAEIPLLERAGARKLLALPHPLAQGYPLGVSTQGGRSVPIRLPADALRRHALLVAKTGKGKSSLLLRLACAQLTDDEGSGQRRGAAHMKQRPGLIVVDPHGDLVAQLLGVIPPARRDDVILVDLADVAYPVALNPLDALLGRDRDKAVESLLQILSQIWARFWGPRMQNALEYALKTLYEANEALIAADPQRGPDQQFTLLEVAPLLSAPGFRRDVLALVRDQALHTWWTHYYQPLDFRLQLEIINPVLTKLASFSGSRVARRVVGQARSTLNLSEVVREGRVLLVNTAKGVVGAETATLVGATLLGTLHVALEEQARLAPEQRRRTLVIVDEFQSLLGVDYGAMLSELRKFGGAFALATQALAHLDTLEQGHPTASPNATLRATVLANVDALYAFAVSAEDARFLSRELDERVSVTDLINLDDYTLYAKLTLAGRRLPTFSLTLDPPPEGDLVEAQRLRARARARYARPVEVVDEALAQAAARYLPPHELAQRLEQDGQAAGTSPATASGTSGTSGTGGTSGSATAGKPAGGRGRFGRASGKAAQRAVSMLMAESLWPEAPASDLTPPAPQQSQMPDTALSDDSEGVLGTERAGPDELDDVDEGAEVGKRGRGQGESEGRGEGAQEEP
ncbi:MAG TPA: type IV secretion system DNA-binding domain-containing protein, partial [Ktedonobacterales bacterium]|nr:type IV secretion system DNA-binding domain-containing protein [Ktedonobacterales bacterium]